MMKKIKLTETQIKKQIKDYFKAMGLVWWWNLQGLGCYHGLPDLMVIDRKGVLWAVEVKRPGGKVSDKQKKFLFVFKDTYCHRDCLVAYSLDDVMEKIK